MKYLFEICGRTRNKKKTKNNTTDDNSRAFQLVAEGKIFHVSPLKWVLDWVNSVNIPYDSKTVDLKYSRGFFSFYVCIRKMNEFQGETTQNRLILHTSMRDCRGKEERLQRILHTLQGNIEFQDPSCYSEGDFNISIRAINTKDIIFSQ